VLKKVAKKLNVNDIKVEKMKIDSKE